MWQIMFLFVLLLSATSSKIEIGSKGGFSDGGSSAEDMRTQHNLLFALYTKLQMPDKLNTIHNVVHHFDGRYAEMWNLLTTKYGGAVEEVMSKQQQYQHTPNGAQFNKKDDSKTPKINLNQTTKLEAEKKLVKLKKKKFPWEEGRSGELTQDEKYAEMEQEIMDFYSVVAPKKMDTTERLVTKYFGSKDREKLENILVRKYFRKSLHLWMRKQGGYDKQQILDKKEVQFHHPDVVAAANDVSRRDLLASVQEFYRTVRPDLADHAKETVNRWSRFPADLIQRLVKKYMPTSGYRWMQRSHRRIDEEKLLESIRKQKNGGKDIRVDF